jgi:uncharacterized protein (TIGR02145 family)
MKQSLVILLSALILIMSAPPFAAECGDVNNSATENLLDITYLINYVYKGGSSPGCGASFIGLCGDVNNDEIVDIVDIIYLIEYIYTGGPAPRCGCGTVSDIDGNVYRTIKIGDQCWMAENLKVTHYRNGVSISDVTDGNEWAGLASGAYCNYGNVPGNADVYGRLYNWYAVHDNRNIAPAGWHVPTDAEWQTAADYLGGTWIAGGKMKEQGTVHWASPNVDATNESGFTALPGGFRTSLGYFGGKGYGGNFWSGTEYDGENAWYIELYYNHAAAIPYYDFKAIGFSIRCVRD